MQTIKKSVNFEGYLVSENQQTLLLSEEDARKRRNVSTKKIIQNLYVPYVGTLELLEFFCTQIFNKGKIVDSILILEDAIEISLIEEKRLAKLKWVSNKKNDIIVDNFVILI